jgi:hypothetical protein
MVSEAPIDLCTEFDGDTSTKTLYGMSRKMQGMSSFHYYIKVPKRSIAPQTPLKGQGLRLTALSLETIREVAKVALTECLSEISLTYGRLL